MRGMARRDQHPGPPPIGESALLAGPQSCHQVRSNATLMVKQISGQKIGIHGASPVLLSSQMPFLGLYQTQGRSPAGQILPYPVLSAQCSPIKANSNHKFIINQILIMNPSTQKNPWVANRVAFQGVNSVFRSFIASTTSVFYRYRKTPF